MSQVTLGGNPSTHPAISPQWGLQHRPSTSQTSTSATFRALTSSVRTLFSTFSQASTHATCATSVRTFNERAAGLDNTVVLCVSADLPFAQGRFCGAEGIANAKTASTFKSSFGDDYGVNLVDGKLAGVLARAVVVVGPDGNVQAHRARRRNRPRTQLRRSARRTLISTS